MAIICKRCVIGGRVQGVFYRATTYEKANELGLQGWVRNLPDGDVECLIQGEQDQIASMMEWFWQGPPESNVGSVQCYDEPSAEYDGFRVTR